MRLSDQLTALPGDLLVLLARDTPLPPKLHARLNVYAMMARDQEATLDSRAAEIETLQAALTALRKTARNTRPPKLPPHTCTDHPPRG